MNRFALTLQDCQGVEHFAEIVQFVGADAQGSFGILAGHVHCIALLRYGLARFCDRDGIWRYLALPGGVLRFADNRLTVTTVRYFLGDNAGLLCEQLAAEMARTDSEIHSARATLSEIERSLVRRLAELGGDGPGGMSA